LCKKSQYDLKGRKISLYENEHQHRFTYDAYDRCLSKTDPFGHTTHYTHTFSEIEERFVLKVTNCSYDLLRRKEREQDANGNVTHYRYNAYGSPTEIHYPERAGLSATPSEMA
jgi:YD repeat-containing protein